MYVNGSRDSDVLNCVSRLLKQWTNRTALVNEPYFCFLLSVTKSRKSTSESNVILVIFGSKKKKHAYFYCLSIKIEIKCLEKYEIFPERSKVHNKTKLVIFTKPAFIVVSELESSCSLFHISCVVSVSPSQVEPLEHWGNVLMQFEME